MMKVAFFSSEVFPFAKTGGLADVAGALPLAIQQLGSQVKIFMPLYKGISPASLNSDFGSSKLGKEVEVIFIKNDDYYARDHLYNTPQGDYPDNLARFSFFCRRSLEVLKKIDFKPDIIHCNDWQSALMPVYLEASYKDDDFFKGTKTVLTIHNLAFQGLFSSAEFATLNLPRDFKPVLELYSKLNFLKAGIITCDRLNTVSPTYAQEIQSKEFGCGLDHILRENSAKISGILNAIDYNVWNPASDKAIYCKYDKGTLDKKSKNKISLQKELGLTQNASAFLLGMVSRLTEQKGIDILSQSLPSILEKHQVVILGTGDPRYHQILTGLAQKYPKDFSLHITFDEVLAHKIYAASDIFLLPSRFEPCGLSQMISFKYATLPLAHQTGGLKDTVIDYSHDQDRGCGFIFSEYSSSALLETIERAYSLFRDKGAWRGLQKKVSQLNFSWRKAAEAYLRLYNQLSHE